VAIEEQVAAIGELIKSGKIRYWGLSNENAFGVTKVRAASAPRGNLLDFTIRGQARIDPSRLSARHFAAAPASLPRTCRRYANVRLPCLVSTRAYSDTGPALPPLFRRPPSPLSALLTAQFVHACEKLGVPLPVSIQNDFAFVDRRFEQDGTAEACSPYNVGGNGIGLLAYGALAGAVQEIVGWWRAVGEGVWYREDRE